MSHGSTKLWIEFLRQSKEYRILHSFLFTECHCKDFPLVEIADNINMISLHFFFKSQVLFLAEKWLICSKNGFNLSDSEKVRSHDMLKGFHNLFFKIAINVFDSDHLHDFSRSNSFVCNDFRVWVSSLRNHLFIGGAHIVELRDVYVLSDSVKKRGCWLQSRMKRNMIVFYL